MYRVEVANSGGSSFEVRAKDYGFTIDTKGKGASPPDTLLAALGSCIGVYIRKYLEGSGLNLRGFIIGVEAEFCEENPVCFKEISVSVNLKEAEFDERRKAAFLAFIKNCPVHNTLKANPSITVKII